MPTGLWSRQVWVREADLDFVSLPGVFQLLAADKEPGWGKRELKQTYITGRGRCYSRCRGSRLDDSMHPGSSDPVPPALPRAN